MLPYNGRAVPGEQGIERRCSCRGGGAVLSPQNGVRLEAFSRSDQDELIFVRRAAEYWLMQVFKDIKKGDRPSQTELEAAFGTPDLTECIDIILQKVPSPPPPLSIEHTVFSPISRAHDASWPCLTPPAAG